MENEADVLDTISNTGSYDYPNIESENENDINQKDVVNDTFSSPSMFDALLSNDGTRRSSRIITPLTKRKLRTVGEQSEEIVDKERIKLEDNLILATVDATNDNDVNEDLNIHGFDSQIDSCVEDNNLPGEQMLSKGKAKI